METNYWQIDEDLYKVHISDDVYVEIKEDFNIESSCKYMKDGKIFADIDYTKIFFYFHIHIRAHMNFV